jgi:aminoglycoside phosphotransferase (APT) family kinase protein
MSSSTVGASTLHPEIARALRDAFGKEPIEDLSVLTGGRSGAVLLSLKVAGVDYVVRRADSTRPGHALRIAHEMSCLKIAAERGVAPKLRHVDVEAGVSIMERVRVAAPDRSVPGRSRRIRKVASTLRHLHCGPAFPSGNSVLFVMRHVDGVLRARGTDGLPERLVRTMEELARLTQRFAETAPCHNDLNPGNILETDEAVFFVDWETAGASDPFFDLGALGVFAFPTADDRAELLEAYLQRLSTEEDRARATIARVMALGFYAIAFLHSSKQPAGSVRGVEAPLSIAAVLALLGASPERASPEVVAAALLEEMRRESESDGYAAARRILMSG